MKKVIFVVLMAVAGIAQAAPNYYTRLWNDNVDKINFAQDKGQGPQLCFYVGVAKHIALESRRDDLWDAYITMREKISKNGWACD